MRGNPIGTGGQQFAFDALKNNDVFSTTFLRDYLHGTTANAISLAAVRWDELYHPERVQPLVESRKQALIDLDDMQSHVTSGFDNMIKKGAAHLAAFAVDPINAVSLGATSNLIGAASSHLAASLATRSLASRAAVAAARGATEFALATVPQGATQLALADSPYHDDFNSIDFVHEEGRAALMGAALGGVAPVISEGLKTLGGKLLEPRRVSQAIDGADAQAIVGNRIDVTPMLQQAFVEARTDGTDPHLDDIQSDQAKVQSDIDTLTQQIEQKTGEIKQQWDTIPEQERSAPLAPIDIARRLQNAQLKSPEELTDLDRQLMADKVLQQSSAVKRAIDLYDTQLPTNLSADDERFLNDTNNQEELGYLSDTPEDNARLEQLARMDAEKIKYAPQSVDLPEFNRAESISRPNFLRRLLVDHDNVDLMLHQREQARASLADLKAREQILTQPLQPLNAEQLVAQGRNNMSINADGAFKASDDTLEREEEKLPDADEIKLSEDEQQAYDALSKTDQTSPMLNELNEERANLGGWRKIYNSIATCLRGAA